jgi:type IV pilus assembly protein PilO
MPELGETRKNLKIVMGALVAADLVAVALLVSPWIGSAESRRQELTSLWQELQAKTRQVEPLRGLDKKIPLAGHQIADFYKDRLPGHESDVAQALGKLASESGVRLTGAKYKLSPAETVDLQPLEIEADVEGSYPQLAHFMNGLERDKVFFIVNSVELAGENGPVKLAMKLETYVKAGA